MAINKAQLQKQAKKRQTRRQSPFRGHGMQQINEAGIKLSPARDFAYNYPMLLQSILRAFNTDHWPELLGFVAEHYSSGDTRTQAELAFDDIEAAKDAICRFCNFICDDPEEDVAGTLERAGWFEVPIPGRIGFVAMMGEVMIGQIWAGVRDVTTQGTKNADIQDLIACGHECRAAMEGLTPQADAEAGMREKVRELRRIGLTFDEIRELVRDVELGRT